MPENFGLSRRLNPNPPDKGKHAKPGLPAKPRIPCDESAACERACWEVLIPRGFITQSLYFCNHHFRIHELVFMLRGYEVRPV